MSKFTMIIDMDRCVGCQTCVVSCQLFHSVTPGVAWNRVDAIEWGSWPQSGRAYFPHGCYHCDDPLCASVCPTGATFKRTDGIVVIDQKVCIGCGVCLTACEYGARSLPKIQNWFYEQEVPAPYEAYRSQPIGVAQKCDFCFDRVAEGLQPWCVESCFCEARIFGDLEDAQSSVVKAIEETDLQQVIGTSVYYAGVPQEWDLQNAAVSDYYKPAATYGTSARG